MILRKCITNRGTYFIAPVILALSMVSATHAQVYKCKRGNVIAYQDKPCPKGTQLGRITLEAPPVVGQTPSSSVSPPKPAPDRGPAAPAAPALLAAAENYQCTRFDGTRYFSASLMPNRQLVDASRLAVPPPGVAPNAKVWATDTCIPAPIKEACDFYSVEMDRVGILARSATGIELKRLNREAMRLRTVSNSRCRR
jgi:hypothetical protein